MTSAGGQEVRLHAALARDDHVKERLTARVLDGLWADYRRRVSYVQTYEQVIADAGATFFNDHIAFRTFASQMPAAGIFSVSRIFEALDYRPAGCYVFEDKSLSAIHYRHPNPQFPKLFISELKTWELSDAAGQFIDRTLATMRPSLMRETLARLSSAHDMDDDEAAARAGMALDMLLTPPWAPPEKSDLEHLAEESQYAAWVLVHAHRVNHFTALVNSHGVESLGDIEKTAAALRDAGVPMKEEIEGAEGSKLRQSATRAVMNDVEVREGGRTVTMPWTYAYFELAERGSVNHPETGEPQRFEGFLGPQASQLLEMTRVST